MTREEFAQKMASKVAYKELGDAIILGFGYREAYKRAFAVLDETYLRCFAPDRPVASVPMDRDFR